MLRGIGARDVSAVRPSPRGFLRQHHYERELGYDSVTTEVRLGLGGVGRRRPSGVASGAAVLARRLGVVAVYNTEHGRYT